MVFDVTAGKDVTESLGFGFSALPPAIVVIVKITPQSWGEKQLVKVGDEVVAVNGKETRTMTADEFKSAMHPNHRPVNLRIEFPGHDMIVGVGEKVGMGFSALPPNPLRVEKVTPGLWAEQNGIVVGNEVVAVNGIRVDSLTTDMFTSAMNPQNRPLTLRVKQASVVPNAKRLVTKILATKAFGFTSGLAKNNLDDDAKENVSAHADLDPPRTNVEDVKQDMAKEQMLDLVVGADVKGGLGIGFSALPPGPIRVNKVTSDTWAERNGVRVSDILIAVNGVEVDQFMVSEFRAAMDPSNRPTTLRVKRGTAKRAFMKAVASNALGVGLGLHAEKKNAPTETVLTSSEQNPRLAEDLAATKLQAAHRGKAGRSEVERLRKARETAKDAEMTEDKTGQDNAAVNDRSQKEVSGRATEGSHVHKEDASSEGTTSQDKDHRQEVAATKLQAAQRGKVGRLEAGRVREEQGMAKLAKEDVKPEGKAHEGAKNTTSPLATQSGDVKDSPRAEVRAKATERSHGEGTPASVVGTASEVNHDHHEETAATKLQAAQRGKVARLQAQGLKEATQMATDAEVVNVKAVETQAVIGGTSGKEAVAIAKERQVERLREAGEQLNPVGNDCPRMGAGANVNEEGSPVQGQQDLVVESVSEETRRGQENIATTKVQALHRGKVGRSEAEQLREAREKAEVVDKAAQLNPVVEGSPQKDGETNGNEEGRGVQGKRALVEQASEETRQDLEDMAATKLQALRRSEAGRSDAERLREATTQEDFEAVSGRDVIVGTDVKGGLGFGLSALPPARIRVTRVAARSWADQEGIRVDDEIVAVNDVRVDALNDTDFKAAMSPQNRPLRLRIQPGSAGRELLMLNVPKAFPDRSVVDHARDAEPQQLSAVTSMEERQQQEQIAATKLQAGWRPLGNAKYAQWSVANLARQRPLVCARQEMRWIRVTTLYDMSSSAVRGQIR
eukprot:TRINITY_DN10316_c0_g1_i2.p1 TRINITY_DN10316_c0_g1~~TRINITY_DN10316_c0_g1_i2.p1  ORF type:complete len:958 (-),score=178.99 TRINITY_DN10316_c0_g1_i2:1013-3886(-)